MQVTLCAAYLSRLGLRALAIGVLWALAGCAAASAPAGSPSAEQISGLEARLLDRPGDAAVMVPLALAHRAAGNAERAESLLEQVVRRDSAAADAVLYLAIVREDRGSYADAKALYERYLRVGRAPATRERVRGRILVLEHRALLDAVRESVQRERELAQVSPPAGTLAVFPFLFQASDPGLRPLSTALADLLTTDLSVSDRLRLVERSRVQLLLDEMKLTESDRVDAATGARSGRMLGAERIVQGSIGGDEALLRLLATLVALEGGALPSEPLTQEDAARRLIAMQKQLALDIFRELGVELSPAELAQLGRRPTEKLPALVAYGQGLESLDRRRYAEAALFFDHARRLDTRFVEARDRARLAALAALAEDETTEQLLGRAQQDRQSAAVGEAVIGDFGRRDAMSEALRLEGVGSRDAVLRIIIRSP
jgi:TolB-like protein